MSTATQAAAATTAAPSRTCANAACGKKLEPPVLCCSKCKTATYCSKACQTAAWKAGHKKECGKQGAAGGMLALLRAAAKEAELPTRLYQLEIKGDSLGTLRLEAEALALAKKLRDSDLETAGFILNLIALSHYRTGSYARACELHEQHRAICEALGDHVGMAAACGNLGCCYHSMGDYVPARELHEQHRAMAEALGDRAGVAGACGNLGNCYFQTGDYARARELYEEHRSVAEALGDRMGTAISCGNLGNCYFRTGDYARAISYFTQTHALAEQMHLFSEQANAALGIGVALSLKIRANLRGVEKSLDAMGEAQRWLQAALDLGKTKARLHLARLACDTGAEDAGLALLQEYLSSCVERGRMRCAGCGQMRAEDAQMLVCGGCHVARFCNAEHQKKASKSVLSGDSMLQDRHKDVCALLGQWRQRVVKGGEPPEELRGEMLAFLRK